MAIEWKEYQEEAAAFFRSLGLDAATNQTVKGIRTKHDIDVLVKSRHAGFEVTWFVECKFWRERVSKLHVLALREIVSDCGADRGILLSESGFQSGAIEAANLTNVQVTSLQELSETTRAEISEMRLRDLYDRIESCNERYWEIPKYERIEYGLRLAVPEVGYSGARVVELCRDCLSRAFRGVYPYKVDALPILDDAELAKAFESPESVVATLEPIIQELERKLSECEAATRGT